MSRRARTKLELLPVSAVRDWAKYLPLCEDVPSYGRDDEAELWWTAMEGLVAGWSASAAYLREKSAVEPLFRLLDIGQLDDRQVSDIVASGLAALATDDPELRLRVGPVLAHHDSARVRSVAVDFLSLDDASERALLRELAGSNIEWLAKEAREKLERAGALDWWAGRFATDPATLVTATEAAALEPGWRRYAELFDVEKPDEAQKDETVRLLESMPARVAAAAARMLLPAVRLDEERLAKVIVAGLREPDAAAIPLQAIEVTPAYLRFDLEKAVKLAAPSLPREVRRAAARDALAHFERASKEELEASDRAGIGAAMAVCGALWPAEDDPTVLFDLYQRWGEADVDPRDEHDLGPALERAAGSAPGLRELFRDWLRDPEAPRFHLLRWKLPEAARTWPAEERLAFARSCLDRPAGRSVLSWVVNTFEALDPETLVARWNDPFLRPEVFSECLDGALFVRARRELREGKLDLHEAACVADRVHRLWGGLAWDAGLRVSFRLPRKPDELEDEDAAAGAEEAEEAREVDEYALKQRAKIADAGGIDVLGPLTDEEWRILRALRDAAVEGGLRGERRAMRLIPVGPWHPVDRAFFDRLVAATLARRDRDGAKEILLVIAAKPLPEFVSLLTKFDDILESEEDRFSLECAANVYARLYPAGAAATPKPATQASVAGAVSAGDDDEEDW